MDYPNLVDKQEHKKTVGDGENDTMSNLVRELDDSKKEYLTAQLQVEKLTYELQLKSENWTEKEDLFKMKIDELEKRKTELETQLQTSANQVATASLNKTLSSTESNIKLVASEKREAALKIELQCSSRELDMKLKVDNAKNKLIEMLDKKITKLEGEKLGLQQRLKSFLEDKISDTDKYTQAMNNNRATTEKVLALEQAYKAALLSNKDLKNMLHLLEDKSSKIGKVAKEKLEKYSKENTDLKEKIATLEKNGQTARAAPIVSDASGHETSLLLNNLQTECKQLKEDLEDIKNALLMKNEECEAYKVKCAEIESNVDNDVKIKQLLHALNESEDLNRQLQLGIFNLKENLEPSDLTKTVISSVENACSVIKK